MSQASCPAALYNLWSGSWLAWLNGGPTAVHYAAIRCPRHSMHLPTVHVRHVRAFTPSPAHLCCHSFLVLCRLNSRGIAHSFIPLSFPYIHVFCCRFYRAILRRARYCHGKSVHLRRWSIVITYVWKLRKIFSRLISLTFPLLTDSNITDLLQRKHPPPRILLGIGVGYGKSGFRRRKLAISLKRLKIARKLLLTAYIKSCMISQLVPKRMT